MVAAIERGFPTQELSVLAELESWRKEVNRPTYHMHKWWATRLGSVTRAILIGALSDAETDIWDSFYDTISFPDKVVLDPFMGAGTTIGEALKLGCTAIGADINPVSTFQVRKAIEPVDTDELKEAFQRVERKVKPHIQSQYQTIDPETGLSVDILYCFWVMTVACPHCSNSVDLFDTTIFAKNAYPRRVPDAQSICLHCGNVHTIRYDSTHEQCPSCSKEYNPQVGKECIKTEWIGEYYHWSPANATFSVATFVTFHRTGFCYIKIKLKVVIEQRSVTKNNRCNLCLFLLFTCFV